MVRQSGEADVQGRISRSDDELTRTALHEAGHSLPIRGARWSALPPWGVNAAEHCGMARELAVSPHRIRTDGREFRCGKQAAGVSEEKALQLPPDEGGVRVVPVETMDEVISLRVQNPTTGWRPRLS